MPLSANIVHFPSLYTTTSLVPETTAFICHCIYTILYGRPTFFTFLRGRQAPGTSSTPTTTKGLLKSYFCGMISGKPKLSRVVLFIPISSDEYQSFCGFIQIKKTLINICLILVGNKKGRLHPHMGEQPYFV